MTENTRESILDKIKKMLELSLSAQKIGNEQEAVTAMAMANKLILKHNVEESELEDFKKKTSQDVENITIRDVWSKLGEGPLRLMIVIGRFTSCKIIDAHHSYMIFGLKDDLSIFKTYFSTTLAVMEHLEKKAWSAYNGHLLRGKFRRDFYQGFSTGLSLKVSNEMRKESESKTTQEKEVERKQIQTQALVLQKKESLIEEKLKQSFPTMKSKAMKNTERNGAFYSGFKEGNNHQFAGGLIK